MKNGVQILALLISTSLPLGAAASQNEFESSGVYKTFHMEGDLKVKNKKIKEELQFLPESEAKPVQGEHIGIIYVSVPELVNGFDVLSAEPAGVQDYEGKDCSIEIGDNHGEGNYKYGASEIGLKVWIGGKGDKELTAKKAKECFNEIVNRKSFNLKFPIGLDLFVEDRSKNLNKKVQVTPPKSKKSIGATKE